MMWAGLCVPDFSNVISKSEIKALAEADEQEVVAEIQVSIFIILIIILIVFINMARLTHLLSLYLSVPLFPTLSVFPSLSPCLSASLGVLWGLHCCESSSLLP